MRKVLNNVLKVVFFSLILYSCRTTTVTTGHGKHKKTVVKTECTPKEENQGILQVIYEDGQFYNQTTFKEIREKIKFYATSDNLQSSRI